MSYLQTLPTGGGGLLLRALNEYAPELGVRERFPHKASS